MEGRVLTFGMPNVRRRYVALAACSLIATVLPLSFARDDFVSSYKRNLQPWSYLVLTRDIVTPYTLAAGAIGISGNEFRPLAYRRALSTEYLPAPYPRHATDDVCKLLELSPGEDCQAWRRLRFRSYVTQALRYDRTLVMDPPAELVSEMERELILEQRRGDIFLFRPRSPPSL